MKTNGHDTLYEFYLHTIRTDDFRARESVERFWRYREQEQDAKAKARNQREQAMANARFDRALSCG